MELYKNLALWELRKPDLICETMEKLMPPVKDANVWEYLEKKTLEGFISAAEFEGIVSDYIFKGVEKLNPIITRDIYNENYGRIILSGKKLINFTKYIARKINENPDYEQAPDDFTLILNYMVAFFEEDFPAITKEDVS